MDDGASDGLPESVFPRAVVLTSVLPLDRKWASRTLAPNGITGRVFWISGRILGDSEKAQDDRKWL